MRIALLLLAIALLVTGCTIPVVGNSPEEIKVRNRTEQTP